MNKHTCSWHDKLIILWILNRQAKISLCIRKNQHEKRCERENDMKSKKKNEWRDGRKNNMSKNRKRQVGKKGIP